jgi:hypothetical protein
MIFDIRVTAFSWPLSMLPYFFGDTYVVFYVVFDGDQHNFSICAQKQLFPKFFPEYCRDYGCSKKCGGPI